MNEECLGNEEVGRKGESADGGAFGGEEGAAVSDLQATNTNGKNIAGKPTFAERDGITKPFGLVSYGPVVLQLRKTVVQPYEVDDELQAIAKRYATYEPIEPREIRHNDIVAMDLETTRAGEPFAPLTRHDALVKLGAGNMPEQFESWILSLAVGDTGELDYSVSVPARDPAAAFESIDVHSRVRVYGLRREIIPAITDRWVAGNITGAASVDALRAKVEDELARRKRDELLSMMPSKLASKLAERLIGVIDDDAINHAFKERNQRIEQNLSDQGLSLSQALAAEGIEPTAFYQQIRREARDALAQSYALVALADHLGLEVTDEAVDRFIDAPTAEEGRRLWARYEADGMGERLVAGVKGMLAIDYLVHTAIIKGDNGMVDEEFANRMRTLYDEQLARRKARRLGKIGQ